MVGTDAGLNLHIRQQIICEKAVATEGKFFVINVIGSDFENIIILNKKINKKTKLVSGTVKKVAHH